MAENYTPEVKAAISKLQNRLKNELPPKAYEDEILLHKFLIARNFDVQCAESMLRKSLQFRKSIQADTIIKDHKPSEVMKKYASASLIGFDKEGSPVRYMPMGTSDVKGILKSSNSFYLLKYVIQSVEIDNELHKQQSKKLGRTISQSVYIYNMDKLSLTQAAYTPAIRHLKRGVSIFQDNYPELLKKIYIINASVIFYWSYSIIKALLAPALRNKIHFYGLNGWEEELLKTIDADVLPAFLGGKRTDPDGNPLCLTFVNHAGKVPESYYLVKDINKTACKPGTKCVRLERQQKISIPIDIEKPMSIINWEFETKCHDVGFGLMAEAPKEEIIPIEKIETEYEPHCGMYRCDKPRKYCIVFDNSYSRFHHKDLYYRTWVSDDNET